MEGSALHPDTLNNHPPRSAPMHGRARSKYNSAIRKACRIGPLTAQKSVTCSTGQRRGKTVIQPTTRAGPGCREDAGCCLLRRGTALSISSGGKGKADLPQEQWGQTFPSAVHGCTLTVIHVCFLAEPLIACAQK